jgi:hypothetical protein
MPFRISPASHLGIGLTGAVLALCLMLSCRPRREGAFQAEGAVDTATPALDSLDQAVARWSRLGPASYRFWLEEGCFCPPAAPIDIVVRHGVVDDSSAVPADSLPGRPDVSQGRLPEARTVDDMFREIRASLRDTSWAVQVEYDSALGYPRWFTVGHRHIADIGHSLRVSRFLALRE